VVIVRRLQKCFNTKNDFFPFARSGYQDYFIAKLFIILLVFRLVFTNAPHFILFMRFSFRNTPGKWFVNAVDFIAVVSFLCHCFDVKGH